MAAEDADGQEEEDQGRPHQRQRLDRLLAQDQEA
jgi:hypothetical protein